MGSWIDLFESDETPFAQLPDKLRHRRFRFFGMDPRLLAEATYDVGHAQATVHQIPGQRTQFVEFKLFFGWYRLGGDRIVA